MLFFKVYFFLLSEKLFFLKISNIIEKEREQKEEEDDEEDGVGVGREKEVIRSFLQKRT